MESARDKAIRCLMDLVDPGETQVLARVKVERAIDAIIDAVRSSESEHTRAVQKSLDVRQTDGKATTESPT